MTRAQRAMCFAGLILSCAHGVSLVVLGAFRRDGAGIAAGYQIISSTENACHALFSTTLEDK